jgi:hypothetical protein
VPFGSRVEPYVLNASAECDFNVIFANLMHLHAGRARVIGADPDQYEIVDVRTSRGVLRSALPPRRS